MKDKVLLNVDADSMIYAAAFIAQRTEKGKVVEVLELRVALAALNNICKDIYRVALEDYQTIDAYWYLTAPGIEQNFRYQIDNTYKQNRVDTEKPVYYNECREFLIQSYGAMVVKGEEAEDTAGIAHVAAGEKNQDAWLVGIDKDLNNVPDLGENTRHYNWRKKIFVQWSKDSSLHHFYEQVLTGDKIDNIKGIDNVGPVTAQRALKNLKTDEDLWKGVLHEYATRDPQVSVEDIIKRGQMLWIRHYPNQVWEAPV